VEQHVASKLDSKCWTRLKNFLSEKNTLAYRQQWVNYYYPIRLCLSEWSTQQPSAGLLCRHGKTSRRKTALAYRRRGKWTFPAVSTASRFKNRRRKNWFMTWENFTRRHHHPNNEVAPTRNLGPATFRSKSFFFFSF
jgi:hypothetical protein